MPQNVNKKYVGFCYDGIVRMTEHGLDQATKHQAPTVTEHFHHATPAFSEQKLFRIIMTEVCRDGGCSLLNSLQNYSSSFQIKQLLKQQRLKSPLSKGELSAFCQQFPNIFDVQKQRNQDPHVVRLRSVEFCKGCCCLGSKKEAEQEALILQERVEYLLRQRSCKLVRRQRIHLSENPAQVEWLARKAGVQIHKYVRLLGPRRPVGNVAKSEKWWKSTMPLFVDFLRTNSQSFVLHNCNDNNNPSSTTMSVALVQPDFDTSLGQVNEIALRVETVMRGAPAVGGMDLGMLLIDPLLRALLGGRDLQQMIQDHIEQFGGIALYRSGNGDTRIKLENDTIETKEGWLSADAVGLYSVTASKSAMAMAKCLARALRCPPKQGNVRQGIGQSETTVEKSICIDLTAGVGGNTIACAKVFAFVLALEIDVKRAELCRQNVNERGCSDKVKVQCIDTLEALPKLAMQFRQGGGMDYQIAAILDPPWGGINYRMHRDDQDEGLGLGEHAPLSKVVMLVSEHLKPLILGVKLPPTFDVAAFTNRLSHPDYCGRNGFQVLSVKKFKRQLFVVLNLP